MKIVNILILSLFLATNSYASDVVQVEGGCKTGLNPLGNSSFSIMHYCEGALGDYIGIVLSGHWSDISTKKWSLSERYWHEPAWGNNVSSYYFDAKQALLYVATSGYYGTAGVYKVDILNRVYNKCTWDKEPKDTSEGTYSIRGSEENKLNIQYSDYDGKHKLGIGLTNNDACVISQ